ncbi:MAG TPA: LuxR C-terminal-related transcriptional regulator [Candidatus Elarobacter sp.]|nr:LuxR C-terminal-related transcriptional regulator [Candidatus Elarobacter sp.]
MSTPWVRRKRERALADGWCTRCCCRRPAPGKRSCEPCNDGAKRRVSQSRALARARRDAESARKRLESAGDAALTRFAYADAVACYQDALSHELPLDDDDRISEKLIRGIFCTSRPETARAWIERAIARHESAGSGDNPQLAIRLALPRQYWLEGNTPQSLACVERARHVLGDRHESRSHIDALTTNYLTLMGRYAEAAPYAARAETSELNAHARGILMNQRAMLAAASGDAAQAFERFDAATLVATDVEDGYLLTIVWDDYANWATTLGRLDIARMCRERALFVAREQRIAWRVPYLSLRYAGLLVLAGENALARDLLAETALHDLQTPILRLLAATIGAQLADATGDENLLGREPDAVALESAFRSREPGWIGPLAAAYARVLVRRGEREAAAALVARALPFIHTAEHSGDVLALAARFGTAADAAHARGVLQRRMRLPNAKVATAFAHLWETYDAVRRRQTGAAKEKARKTARLFAAIGWQRYERIALGIADPAGGVQSKPARRAPAALGELRPALSARELQVAELVLRGQTNRAIADALAISEHTVESHMTSIFNRLGLRSRWQLLDLVK